MNSKLKFYFFLICKVLFVLLLIYYLFSNNFIDFKNIFLKFKFNIYTFFAVLSLFLITFFLASLRWYLLLKSIKFKINFKKIFEVIYISNFFNTILLGGIGGDIFRTHYISKSSDFNKLKLMTTVLIDRVIGFIGLLTVGLFFLILIIDFFELIELIKKLNFQILLTFIFTIFGLLFCYFIFKKSKNKFSKLQGIFYYIKKYYFVILISYFLSILLFLTTNLIVFLITVNFFSFEISILQIYFSNSITILFNSLPLTPGGIGLGELSFVKANEFVGAIDLLGLANVIIFFRIINFTISIPSIFLYILFKNKKYSFDK